MVILQTALTMLRDILTVHHNAQRGVYAPRPAAALPMQEWPTAVLHARHRG